MSLFDDLNLDPAEVTWLDFASCKGTADVDPNLFYETYEDDPIVARQVDTMCSRCPVLKACSNAGKSNKEVGVWGGFYRIDGKIDRVRNKNKDTTVKRLLESRINE